MNFSKTIYLSLALVFITRDLMIVSFGSKTTEKIWNGEAVRKIPIKVQQIGRRKLRMINNSQNWSDLRIPPSNKPEKLKGTDFFSIRINKQWRIVFRWLENQAHEVEISDYH